MSSVRKAWVVDDYRDYTIPTILGITIQWANPVLNQPVQWNNKEVLNMAQLSPQTQSLNLLGLMLARLRGRVEARLCTK